MCIRDSIENQFALPDNATLDQHITDRTRAIVFSNPGNPTGAVYGRETLARILAWAARHGIFVIADEVYRRIWFDEAPTSALEFEAYRDHVICVDSLSKTYSACGARVGFFISRNEDLMEKVERLGQARLGTQPLAQHVALAALSLPESYYDEVRATYKRRVDALMDCLGSIEGVQAPRPAGAFYAMLNLPVDDSERFARWLVEEFRLEGEGLVVAPGPGFYSDPSMGRTEVRVAAVLREADLRRAMDILSAGLEAYPGRI